jgi:hypothetical protein
MKTSTIIFFAILALLASLASCVLLRPAVYTAQQANKVFEKTVDADNMIYNYEWFKSRVQDIWSMDRKIVIARGELASFLEGAGPREKWDFRDKEEAARLRTNYIGICNVRSDMVAEYNARSRMANRAIFMGKDVPEFVNP